MTLRTMFLAATAVAFAGAAGAETKYPAVLEGHAILPAQTVIPAPADAPAELQISGRFATPSPKRVDEPESVTGISALSNKSAPRTTGIKYPFKGQPIQGLSGIKNLHDGTFLTLTDNGFGSKANSPDAMLMFHVIRPDWKSGKLERLSTTFLHDPDRKVQFRIVNENTPTRYLTGADFDIESIQPIGDALWFGEELGPFLVKTDLSGKVLQVFDTTLDGKTLRSPDNPYLTSPPAPGPMKFEVKRSKGFEGMAQSPDGKHLYGLLEGPLWLEVNNTFENKDGKPYLRILEFDVEKGAFTGKSWKYPLELPGNAIGDFNLIDATSGLIIERDDGEGDEAQACQGTPQPDCFNVPAKFKRIYKIDFAQADADGFVKKVGYIDLLDIQDPNKVARQGGKDGKFTFPFFTIENVDVVDADHIIVGNDNNLPFSSGRAIGRSDDNEMVLLRVPELLRAK